MIVERRESWEAVRAAFRWRLPARYNIAEHACERHAASGRPALVCPDPAGGEPRLWSFRELSRLSNRLANALAAAGIGRGDRVAVLLGQGVETGLAHLAAYKLGAVALPLFTLFGEEALAYRLGHSGAKALITDAEGRQKVAALDLPALSLVVAEDFWGLVERASDRFEAAATGPDDPALLIYTSGTTGPPKGALHGHRVLPGHLPGVALPQEFFPQPGDLFWTPADWAWAGGLLDVLLPAWAAGVPVLASRPGKFDPEEAFALIARCGVRNAFLPPTALKMMRQAPPAAQRAPGLAMRSIGSGGESLGAELLDWGRDVFGLTINEFYGQTECNLVVGNCASLFPVRPGWLGRAIPGHEVAVLDGGGNRLPPGEAGEIAVRRPDPVMFLGYWRDEEATAAKFNGDWLLTGDLGVQDEDGAFRFVGREDDVISSAGYRIGPGEIEECLMGHPAVAMAAAVGAPDPVRGEIVKAFVVLRAGEAPTGRLDAALRAHVRDRLSAHEYPRAVEFVPALPMTATGKVRRRDLRLRERRKAGLA